MVNTISFKVSKMNKLTVKQYTKKYKISTATFYIYQREGKVNTVLVDKKRYIEDKKPLTNSEMKNTSIDSVDNTINSLDSSLDTIQTPSKYDEYKEQIIDLKEEVKLQKKEIQDLHEKIDNIRIQQTTEIINLQKVKDEQLKTFMELIAQNTNNILTHKQENVKNTENTDTVEVEIIDDNEIISLKKYVKQQHKSKDKQIKLKDKIVSDYKKHPSKYKRIENKLYLYTHKKYDF